MGHIFTMGRVTVVNPNPADKKCQISALTGADNTPCILKIVLPGHIVGLGPPYPFSYFVFLILDASLVNFIHII